MTSAPTSLLAQLPEAASGGPEWLRGQRAAAAARLRDQGLPNRKVEAFRFTPLRGIADGDFVPASAPAGAAAALRGQADDGTCRVVLAAGRPLLDATAALPAGVTLCSLREVLASDPSSLADTLGRHVSGEHFAGLNTALFEDGLVVRVSRGATPDRPLHLVYAPPAAGEVAYARVVVVVEEGARLVLAETHAGRPDAPEGVALTNGVTELFLADGAQVEHVRALLEPSAVLTTVAVEQARDSRYLARTVALGGGLARTSLEVTLAGPGAECALEGTSHVAGREVVDHHVHVTHVAERCQTRQRYRAIADEKGTYVFDGIVKVARTGRGAEAHQESKNLLLGDDATVHTKPHLEIDTDDIVASHGATVGALEDEQVFYLRSRAIGEVEARAVLTYAFVAELLGEISHAPLREALVRRVLARLPHGELLAGLGEESPEWT